MAKNTRPDFYYHPVVGSYAPATLGVYLSAARISSPLPATTDRKERHPMTLSRTATCIVTDETLPITDMVRFVIAPDGHVVADLTQKLPGIFLWVKADAATLKKAIRRNSFAAHTRQTVTIPNTLLETVITGLSKQALQCLSMAKGAGELRFGFTKTEEVIRDEYVGAYIVASDAKDNGREKLERLATAKDIPTVSLWSSAELSAAIGESNIMHIALASGGLGQKFLDLVKKFTSVKSES